MSTVKIGGKSYDSAALMKAVEGAKLQKTSKGGLVVILTFDPGTNYEKMVKVTRNQLVKLVVSLEKKDKSRPLSDRIKNLNTLSQKLDQLKESEEINVALMTTKDKAALTTRQKWGNLFFKRDKALEHATQLLKSRQRKAVATINETVDKYAHNLLNNFTNNLKHMDKSDVQHTLDMFKKTVNNRLAAFIRTLPDSKFLSGDEIVAIVDATAEQINSEL